MILQVHDELVFEADEDFVDTLLAEVRGADGRRRRELRRAAGGRQPGWATTGTRRTESHSRGRR
jgi:hypothetical protein